jgi:hypothetical protein
LFAAATPGALEQSQVGASMFAMGGDGRQDIHASRMLSITSAAVVLSARVAAACGEGVGGCRIGPEARPDREGGRAPAGRGSLPIERRQVRLRLASHQRAHRPASGGCEASRWRCHVLCASSACCVSGCTAPSTERVETLPALLRSEALAPRWMGRPTFCAAGIGGKARVA